MFEISVSECSLQAGETVDLEVTVRLDETYAFSDTLHILVANGDEISIPLSATGVGSTLVSEELTGKDVLEFGHQYTGAQFNKTVTIYNYGRRPRMLVWNNLTLETLKKEKGKVCARQ